MSDDTVTITLPREVAERAWETIGAEPYSGWESGADLFYVLLSRALDKMQGAAMHERVNETWGL